MEKRDAKKYMGTYHPDTMAEVKRSLLYLHDEHLQKQIEDYFLEECEKVHYNRDKIRSLKAFLTRAIPVLNTQELEYDIAYLLTFFAPDFRTLFYELSCICTRANMILTGICACYLRYCGKKDLNEVYKNLLMKEMLLLYEEAYGEEVRQVFEDVLEIEENLIQESYQKASQGETFCETCAPCCWIVQEGKKEKTKYKRTTPFRY